LSGLGRLCPRERAGEGLFKAMVHEPEAAQAPDTAGEAARSAALRAYGVLDSPREAEFDDIARIAAEVCGTPVALVSFVAADRQFFKAEVGFGARGTPMEMSFCAHALRARDFMMVPDAAADERFAANPLVTGERGIRFYAGALLETSDGVPLGTVCVLDTRPRELDEQQVRTLKLLARQAMIRLELGRALAEQRAEAARHRTILDAAVDYAIVVLDPEGRVTGWNKGAESVFGWGEAEILGVSASRIFTPEDRARDCLSTEMARALSEGRASDERWHLRKDAARFWGSGEMTPLLGETGEHLGFVKVLRDRTSEHVAGERLRLAEARLRQAQEAGGVGVFTVEIESGLLDATPEFSRLYGLEHRDRRPAQDFERLVVPEDQALVSHKSTRKVGSAPRDVEYRIRRPSDGAERWIARRGEFERGADGQPVRFTGVAQDITGRVAARRQLEDERELLAQMFEQAPTFMALLRGPEHRFERVNPGYTKLVGGRDVVGQTVAEALPEVVEQGFIGILDEAYRSGTPYQAMGTRIALQADPQGPSEERYLDFVYQPIRNILGEVTGIFVEGADVTERVAAEAHLAAAERRYRTLFNSIDSGFCVVEMIFEGERPVDYRILEHNSAFERHTGLSGMDGRTVREMVPQLEEFWYETYGRVARTGEPARFRHQAVPMEGRWFEVFAFRLDDPVPDQVGILFSDISERVAAENQRQLLNRELSHRLKNTLATVQSIAGQTLRSAPDMNSARAALTARIQALANAHDILLKGAHDAGSIEEIVHGAVSVHDDEGRITLAGPPLTVGPTAALGLSLTCHELATNAGKYGGLSVPEGRVAVTWRVEARPDGEATFVFDWVERDGPPVLPPTRKGFGTRLIEIGLSGPARGTVELSYAAAGLRCRIVAPLRLLEDAAEG
jgi:PAS domain S-box-containing protein